MLKRAAAANAEMPADRRDALRACNLDFGETTAVGVPRPGLGLDDLARQRMGHVDGASDGVRDTLAARA